MPDRLQHSFLFAGPMQGHTYHPQVSGVRALHFEPPVPALIQTGQQLYIGHSQVMTEIWVYRPPRHIPAPFLPFFLLRFTQLVPSLRWTGYSILVGIAFFFLMEAVSKTPRELTGLRSISFISDGKNLGVLIWVLFPIIAVIVRFTISQCVHYSCNRTSHSNLSREISPFGEISLDKTLVVKHIFCIWWGLCDFFKNILFIKTPSS